ncbi:MAG TPA: RDD family protein [Polyangia bacterium]|jgi:uncharacterized RDD family membrane protein YckC|nr:RDD family protein [Polyangia bacterium]
MVNGDGVGDPSGFVLASRGERLGGYLLDGLITLPFLLPTFVLGFRFGRLAGHHEVVPGTLTFAALLCLAGVLVFCGYQMYLEAAKGQSLGKRWMKTKIVALDGTTPGFARAILLRRGVTLALYLGVLRMFGAPLAYAFMLVDLLMIFGAGNRCLHDRIAGTRVVREDAAPSIAA